jgi:DNA-binding NarL/FixJ family response regulator
MISLMIVCDTRMMCELLASVLQDEVGINVAGVARDAEEAAAVARTHNCNMALIDANATDFDVLDVTHALRNVNEDIHTVIIGLVDSKAAILPLVEEGISGYVLEDETVTHLVRKINAVHEGEFEVSPRIASSLMQRVAALKKMTKDLYGLSLSQRADGIFTELTPREWEVLGLIERGYDNKMIADTLIIEKGTVKNHVHSILSKLDVNRREQAAVLMRQLTPEQKHAGLEGAAVAFAQPDPVVTQWDLGGREAGRALAYAGAD